LVEQLRGREPALSISQRSRMLAQRVDWFARQTIHNLDSAFASQYSCTGATQDANPNLIVVTAAMIEHDDRAAAGLQHSMDFAQRCLDVWRVMQHAMRIDHVECLIREIQLFGISNAELAAQSGRREITAREIDRGLSQIDSGVDGAGARKLQSVRADAAPDLQHAQSLCRREIGGEWNMPLFFVAMPLHSIKKFARADFRVAEFCAAWMRLPELAHSFL